MIFQGDCIDVLRGMPAASVDAIVTDPPYGLEFMGKEWDSLGGDGEPVASRSAGRAMQDFHESWAREAYRVLKPGGHLLAFGGSRTSHRLACAIEDGGFEIRDGLSWLYGQGFPKSLDVSKAIDKAAGAERTVVTGTRHRNVKPFDDDSGWNANNTTGDHAYTAPATDDASKWEGWGTALKPAQEPIVLARKPLLERTVAANVVKHGTGALNIDGCRIGDDGGTVKDRSTRGSEAVTSFGNSLNGGAPIALGSGRWPANVLLSHVPDDFDADSNEVLGCRCVGTREYAPGAPTDEIDAVAGEIVCKVEGSQPIWECAPGCPVAALDAQSGPAGAAGVVAAGTMRAHNGVFGVPGAAKQQPDRTLESGGASRFFYQSKATNSERWGYCHDCGIVFNRGDKAERAAHKPHKVEYHPTVKPVGLMRWLVRLVTPPGGTVLDPFCGTGTTGEAARAEGFQFTGIEREPIYAAIATHRLRALGLAPKKLLPRRKK